MKRSFALMGGGLLLVVIFSDPMVGVMTELGKVLGINAFYIGFTLAPIASNASELLSTYTYANKKTISGILTAHSTCLGAGCMNNTFCLSIFLMLIATNSSLTWSFTAETMSILIIEATLVLTLIKKTHTVLTGVFILCLYPLTIVLVYLMNNVLKWD